MKVAAIIAEYNPFHKGHAYQIKELRSRTGAEYIVVVMSGDFVQRGEPAIYDKHTRALMALHAGVDLVLELPVCFATGSANDFASCGVALLDRLGVVGTLCFGTESGDLCQLSQLALVLGQEPAEYVDELQKRLRQGMSFPKARSLALLHYFSPDPSSPSPFGPDWGEMLSSPNNILAVEYLRALKKRGSPIAPLAIRRFGQAYHDEGMPDASSYASASAIRKAIKEGCLPWAYSQVPLKTAALMQGALPVWPGNKPWAKPTPIFPDDLTPLLNHRLLELPHAGLLARFLDMSPELAARLEKNSLYFDTFSGRVSQLKTRGYTYTRVSRALLHVLLNITAEQAACFKSLDYVAYARILGFSRHAGPLLSHIKRNASLPLVTKTANARKILGDDGLAMLQTEFYASHLYQSLIFAKSLRRVPNEYSCPVAVLH